MSWGRFHYVCRKGRAALEVEDNIEEVLARIENDDLADFYGEPIPKSGPLRRLLNNISKLPDISSVAKVLELYSAINIPFETNSPISIKRTLSYLGYVVFVFTSCAGIYRAKVMPGIMEVYEMSGSQAPNTMVAYWEHADLLLGLITLILVAIIICAIQIKMLFHFGHNTSKGWLFRISLLPNIQRAYLDFFEVLHFPLKKIDLTAGSQAGVASPLWRGLIEMEDSGMDMGRELNFLANSAAQKLVVNCEKQLRLMYAMVVVLMITAALFFLLSAYSPIFVMGSVI